MKAERIDITVPESVLAENPAKQRRLSRAMHFERPDRVPVLAGDSQFLMLAARGRTFGDYIRSPEDNLREQILNRKWRIENIRDDAPIPLQSMSFRPDLGTLRGTEFPMQIVWLEDGPPKCVHPLQSLEDIDRLTVPPPDGALNARYIDWYHQMREAAERLDVRLNGRPLRIEVSMHHGGGPIPAAFALAGENLFLWSIEDPVRVHRLMDIVTTSHLNCVRFFDEMCGRPTGRPVWMGCDTAEMFGPEMFRQFVVPYCQRIWEKHPGPRDFHMCGKIDHLLTIIRDEMQVTHLDGFGSVVDRRKLAAEMAGRVALRGGPAPLLIRDGPREAIVAECLSYIDAIGQDRGFVLSTGGGAAPGTPPEHFQWMIEASIEASR